MYGVKRRAVDLVSGDFSRMTRDELSVNSRDAEEVSIAGMSSIQGATASQSAMAI